MAEDQITELVFNSESKTQIITGLLTGMHMPTESHLNMEREGNLAVPRSERRESKQALCGGLQVSWLRALHKNIDG